MNRMEQVQDAVDWIEASTEPTETEDGGPLWPGVKWLDTSSDPHVLKRRNTANDGWVTVGASGGAAPLTTKGDLYTHDGSSDARLGVGSDDQVLTADSAAATGLKWAAAGGGGSGATTLLDSVELAADAASISFSGISGAHKRLVVEGLLRSDRTSAAFDGVIVRVGNGTVDSGSNYLWAARRAPSNSITQASSGSDDGIKQTNAHGMATGPVADADAFAYNRWTFEEYAVTARDRTIRGEGGAVANNTPSYAYLSVIGRWANTADVIDIITFLPQDGTNFVSGSRLYLYGVS